MRMADEQKDGFVFYRSFIEAAQELPEERRWDFIRGIAEYALDGKDPEFTGLEKICPKYLENKRLHCFEK